MERGSQEELRTRGLPHCGAVEEAVVGEYACVRIWAQDRMRNTEKGVDSWVRKGAPKEECSQIFSVHQTPNNNMETYY